MTSMVAQQIGTVIEAAGPRIEVLPAFRPALQGLDDFSHLTVLWWFSETDGPTDRSTVTVPSPYRLAPETLGIFATRAPTRPTPIGLSVATIIAIDETGIDVAYLDANPGTPVIDLKPYTPSIDRVETPRLPAWCAHWPTSIETAGDFDWAGEFRFE